MPAIVLRRLPLVLVALAALAGALFLRDSLSFAALAQHHAALVAFRDAHVGLAVLAFMAAYVTIVALSLPGATVATLTGGFLFGLWPGALINVGAATIGACLIFLAVRAGLGEALSRRIAAGGGTPARLQAAIAANQWSVLFLMRLLPLVPFFVANVLPALIPVPLSRFAVTTFLGIIPGGIVFTSVGAGLSSVLAAGAVPDLGIIFTPPILIPLLGLSALAALPLILKGLRPRLEGPQA